MLTSYAMVETRVFSLLTPYLLLKTVRRWFGMVEIRSVAPFCPACSCGDAPLAIMGVRVRARRQSHTACSKHDITMRLCLDCLDYSLPITWFSDCCRNFSPRPSYSVTRHVYNGGGTTTRSSCDFRRAPAWAVDLSARHHRPGDARHLVGQRHGRQPDGSALQHTPQPCARRAVPMRCAEHH